MSQSASNTEMIIHRYAHHAHTQLQDAALWAHAALALHGDDSAC